MIEKDALFTLAELAVALAGFSAIIGVLSTRKGSSDIQVNSLRLQVMLETCFMVAAASLIPVLLDQFGMDHAVFLCVAIPFEFVARNRTKGIPNMTLTKMNVNTVNWGLSLGADLALVAIVFKLVGAHAQPFYLIALFFQLFLAGILFVQFAAETFTPPDQDNQ